MDFLRGLSQEYIILNDCEIIANIDLKPFIKRHRESEADITVMYAHGFLNNEAAKESNIFNFDLNERLVETMNYPDLSGEFDFSLNRIIMGREFLIQLVTECISKGEYDLSKDVLQNKCKTLKIYGYKYDDYFGKISSLVDYYHQNLSLLEQKTRDKLFMMESPIYTKIRDEAPVRYGLQAKVKNCFIADGCIIEGHVENSILFRGCRVKKGAVVKNSVLMQGTTVGEDSAIDYTITDKNVTFSPSRTMVGAINYPAFVTKGTTI